MPRRTPGLEAHDFVDALPLSVTPEVYNRRPTRNLCPIEIASVLPSSLTQPRPGWRRPMGTARSRKLLRPEHGPVLAPPDTLGLFGNTQTPSGCRGKGAFMSKPQTLNARQRTLLERIASGDDLSAPDDASLRTTVYALASRGLVSTEKRGGVFRARITDSGRLYLHHGQSPNC